MDEGIVKYDLRVEISKLIGETKDKARAFLKTRLMIYHHCNLN